MPSTRTPHPVSTRGSHLPSGGTTFHLIGDLHVGAQFASGLGAARRNKVSADITLARLLPVPNARLGVGDVVNDGITSQDATAQAFFNGLPSAPWYAACGNHDIWANVRTPEDWAAAYAYSAKNYVVDVGGMRLVVIAPDTMPADNTTINITQATMDWMDTQFAGTSDPCFVVCHAPLYDTVRGDETTMFTSVDATFALNGGDDTAMRALLASHSNVKGWLSGHTHSPLLAPGIVTATTVGSRSIAHISASALAFVGKSYFLDSPLICPYVTYLGDRVEVRWRNHGAGVWDGPAGVTVTTVAVG